MIPNNKGNASIVRLCVLMLALALATLCLSMGTVAKYATTDSVQDAARVAKFGVEIVAADTSTFKTEYSSADNSITVKSSNGDKIVAPGTSDDGGLAFTIKGTPEVATHIDISLSANKDIFLKLKKDGQDFYYHPIKFTLTNNGDVLATGDLATIVQTLNDYSAGARNEAFTSVSNDYTLTWKWDYSESPVIDEWDTTLGDLAAGIIPTGFVNGQDYSVDIEYAVTISVYQVD